MDRLNHIGIKPGQIGRGDTPMLTEMFFSMDSLQVESVDTKNRKPDIKLSGFLYLV